jgi:leader peptidase (prepilin peptidase)/N-methyltransferase
MEALLPVGFALGMAGFVGAVLTSFGRLAVARLPHQLGWREDADPSLTLHAPPSHCEGCGSRIRARHLIPVLGWVLARGRCPDCGMRVSVAHPLMELLGGAGAAAMLAWFGLNGAGLAGAGLWLTLLFLAEIDWRETWLPTVVTQPLFWLGLIASPFAADADARILGAFGGSAAMWSAMWLAGRWRGVDAMAGGDIALAAAAGAWLGIVRVPLFLLASALVFIAYALPARWRGRVWVPMGPALALGWLAALPWEGEAAWLPW